MDQKHVQMDQIYQSHQLPTHFDTYTYDCGQIRAEREFFRPAIAGLGKCGIRPAIVGLGRL